MKPYLIICLVFEICDIEYLHTVLYVVHILCIILLSKLKLMLVRYFCLLSDVINVQIRDTQHT